MRSLHWCLVLLGLACASRCASAAGKASHVILIVWDGMRPDFVTPKTTPTLCQLASNGVTFTRHHPVFPSVTEVNGTALATGVYPALSGIIGNRDYRPAIDPEKPIEAEVFATVRKGDEVLSHHYIAYPTVAELLHANGLQTIIAGAKPIAMLHDRDDRPDNDPNLNLFAGETLPAGLKAKLDSELGDFPAAHGDKIKLDDWTASALTGPLWKNGVPPYSLLWLAEPDYSQHLTAPGSPTALKAIRDDDDNLARVLQVLKDKSIFDSTDIILVSDHGFSTVFKNSDIAGTLTQHGLRAYRKVPGDGARDGDVMVVGDAGTAACYVKGQDPLIIGKVVHYLQAEPYTGVILSRIPVEGAFSLADAHVDSAAPPDVVVGMRWNLDTNQFGVPGMIYSDGEFYPGNRGTHGTLGATDMHNIGFAFGPDFARGMSDALPSGNIDITPTILWLLGVEPKEKLSGRVLTEALTIPGPPIDKVEPHHLEASFKGEGFTWHQYLDWSSVNGVCYLDKGNGSQE